MLEPLAAEIERLEGELVVLRALHAEAVALSERVDRALNPSPAPAPAKPKAKRGPKQTKRRQAETPATGDGEGSPRERVLGLLAAGPKSQAELVAAGVSKGAVGAACRQLADEGKIVRDGQTSGRGRPSPIWRLAGTKPAPTPKVEATNGQPDSLVYRVLETVAHKRMGADGIARELDEERVAVADALEVLEDAGDIVFKSGVYEAAA